MCLLLLVPTLVYSPFCAHVGGMTSMVLTLVLTVCFLAESTLVAVQFGD